MSRTWIQRPHEGEARARLLRAALAVLALAAMACEDPPPPAPEADAGVACASRADCTAKGSEFAGMICSAGGRCGGCASNGDCELRELCDGPTLRCVFRTGWAADCRLNPDCLAGELCVQGLCVPERQATLCSAGRCLGDGQRCNRETQVCEEDLGCAADADCGPAELCHLPAHRCVLRCTAETVGEVCGASQRCVDGRCADCADAVDCPGGMVCDPVQLRCLADGSLRCASDRECAAGLLCNRAAGFCAAPAPPCVSNEQCLPDERCEIASGKCLRRACQPDRFEPNDPVSLAAPLGAGTSRGMTLCDGEEDWYRLTLVRGDRLDVLVEADPLLEELLETQLFDSTGRLLAGGALALDRVVATDGEYSLRLRASDPWVEYGLRLTLTRGTPCDDDRFEPNDAVAAATPVAAAGEIDSLRLCGGDVDAFLVEVPSGTGVRIEVHHLPTEGDADLFVYDRSGATELGRSATVEAVEAVELDATAATGGILVKVVAANAEANAAYWLRVVYGG